MATSSRIFRETVIALSGDLELGVDERLYVVLPVVDHHLQDDDEEDNLKHDGCIHIPFLQFVEVLLADGMQGKAQHHEYGPCRACLDERCEVCQVEVAEDAPDDGECRGEVGGAEEYPGEADIKEGEQEGAQSHIPTVGYGVEPSLAELVYHQSYAMECSPDDEHPRCPMP